MTKNAESPTEIRLALDGHWDDLLALIDSDPGIAQKDYFGSNLLTDCAHMAGSADVLRKLVSLGCDPSARCPSGNTPLTSAVTGGSRYGLTTIPEITALVELGADINGPGENGYPPLHWAIMGNRLDYAEVLLRLGADQSVVSENEWAETAAEVAQQRQNKEALRLLQDWTARGPAKSR
jgi:ankyrin repeat protein